jgi:tetratricopeptide (TPR) repeat protein
LPDHVVSVCELLGRLADDIDEMQQEQFGGGTSFRVPVQVFCALAVLCNQRRTKGGSWMGIHHRNGNGCFTQNSTHSSTGQSTTGGLILELHDFLLDLGVRAERRGELQSALDLYANAVSAQPDSAMAWYNYGDVLLALKRDEEAISPLSKAVQLSPHTALFHYDLGLALSRLDRHEEASKEFAGIVANDPQLKRASSVLVLSSLTNLALTQDSLGRPDEAAQILKPALQKAIEILYNLGRFNLCAKRAAQAIGFLQAAALLAPDSEDIIHGVGRTLMDLKRESEAVPFLVKSTKLNPRCTDAWYDLGVTLSRLKQRKKARSCFVKALRLDQNYAWAYYDLACLDALERKRNAAFQNLEKAIALGFQDIRHLRRDADLRSLRRDARWKAVLATIRSPGAVITTAQKGDN